jgi:hypothetical protein
MGRELGGIAIQTKFFFPSLSYNSNKKLAMVTWPHMLVGYPTFFSLFSFPLLPPTPDRPPASPHARHRTGIARLAPSHGRAPLAQASGSAGPCKLEVVARDALVLRPRVVLRGV